MCAAFFSKINIKVFNFRFEIWKKIIIRLNNWTFKILKLGSQLVEKIIIISLIIIKKDSLEKKNLFNDNYYLTIIFCIIYFET